MSAAGRLVLQPQFTCRLPGFFHLLRDNCVSRRKDLQAQQNDLRQSLSGVKSSVDSLIRETMETIERRVSGTLNEEIRRLGELVDDFDRPFHPDPMLLVVYKKELNEHLEKQLGKKLMESCASDIHKEVKSKIYFLLYKMTLYALTTTFLRSSLLIVV